MVLFDTTFGWLLDGFNKIPDSDDHLLMSANQLTAALGAKIK